MKNVETQNFASNEGIKAKYKLRITDFHESKIGGANLDETKFNEVNRRLTQLISRMAYLIAPSIVQRLCRKIV